MIQKPLFLDLFAGAGGLSEGFIQAGFQPVAHVESDTAACNTLRTRVAWHWLKNSMSEEHYASYISGNIKRDAFYQSIPAEHIRSVINAEINKELLSDISCTIDSLLNNRRLDLIIGGPPCQAYSLVGRARDENCMKGDKRNFLYVFYAEFLKKYKPTFFVFENVAGLLSAKNEKGELYFNNMRQLFREVGYETEFKVLSAEDYGVLQRRRRVILVGKLGKDTGFFPEPEKWDPQVLTEEVFSGLPNLKSGQGDTRFCKIETYNGFWLHEAGIRCRDAMIPVTWHKARQNTEQDLEIYRYAVDLWNKRRVRLNYNALPDHLKTHRNRISFTDRFKVVASDLPYSHTLVAHIAKDGHYYIHPDISQNRSITPREAARIQTFPDDYFFEGTSEVPAQTAAFKQIGNAVPVLLAQKIAKTLRNYF